MAIAVGTSPLDLARYRAPSLVSPTAPKPSYPSVSGPTPGSVPNPPAPRPPISPTSPGLPTWRPSMPSVAPMAPGNPVDPIGSNSLYRPPAGNVTTGVPGPNIQRPIPEPPPGPVTDFGPGNDLRSSQINPAASDRLKSLQSTVDTGVKAVGSSPSLSEAAAKQFEQLGIQSANQRKLGIQDIGRSAATLGRLGSGMVTTDLGNLEDVLRQREESARASLSANVAQQEAADRRANLASTSGLEGQVAGQEAAARGEVRGERGYQTDTAQTALENQIRQKQLEESLTQGAFGRDLAAGGAGLTAAELQGNTATQESGAAGDALANLGLQQSLDQYSRANPTARTPASPADIVSAAGGSPTAPPGYKYVNGRLIRLQPGEPVGAY